MNDGFISTREAAKMLGIAHFFDGVLLNYANPDLIRWAVGKIGRVGKKGFEIGIYAPAYVYTELNPKVHRSLQASSAVVALGAPNLILRKFVICSWTSGYSQR
jgi:hypothetical protein